MAAALVAAVISLGAAQAHGGEVALGVSCMAPDSARPLSRVCTAVVTYVDGDPVVDAELSLKAVREQGERRTFGPVPFQPARELGVYTAAFEYPAYGAWSTQVAVTEPGKGEVELREEVLPPLPGAIGSSVGSAQVRIVLDFDARELANITVRAVHLGAAAAWFAAPATVLAISTLLSGWQRERLMRSAARWFPWLASGTFLVLGLTGWYSAVYNVPSRPPGLLDPGGIGQLSFGPAYLAAFLAKICLTGAMIAIAGALALTLRKSHPASPGPISGGALAAPLPARRVERWVVGLSATSVVLGSLVFIDVVVLGYLHILTHIGGIYGAR